MLKALGEIIKSRARLSKIYVYKAVFASRLQSKGKDTGFSLFFVFHFAFFCFGNLNWVSQILYKSKNTDQYDQNKNAEACYKSSSSHHNVDLAVIFHLS